MQALGPTVYFLCFITSTLAMLLLFRSHVRTRSRLLLWSALGFVALALNNFFLFADIVLLPSVSLLPLRDLSALAAALLLLYGFVWEID
ncbi:MAG TPA: DUF5985 family protein [Stellaceae bacterium]|nr:DUF5985 family protein [Stellaceae bacterium]